MERLFVGAECLPQNRSLLVIFSKQDEITQGGTRFQQGKDTKSACRQNFYCAEHSFNNPRLLFIKNLISDNAFQSVPFGATFHRDDSETALDLCLIVSEDIIIDYWKSDTPFADDHDLISGTIKCSITKPILRDIIYRDFKFLDGTAFANYFRTCDWSAFDKDSTFEERIQCLYKHLQDGIALHALLKTVKQTGR